MAERKENSVLFSLNELRSIEEERQQEAVDAKRRNEEERVRAQMEAERRTREEADARQRAIEDAERAAREATDRASREERIRIEEAERRARIEAQSHLESQRMAQEMQIRAMEAQKKRPTGLIAFAVVMVLAVAGLAIFLVQRSNEAEQQEKLNAAYREEVEKSQKELQLAMAEQTALIEDLRNAKTEEARKQAEEALAAKKAEIDRKNEALSTLKKSATPTRRPHSDSDKPKDNGAASKPKCDPNDPLCGI